jgi:hypothetical protein
LASSERNAKGNIAERPSWVFGPVFTILLKRHAMLLYMQSAALQIDILDTERHQLGGKQHHRAGGDSHLAQKAA